MVYLFPPNQINGMAILQWLGSCISKKKQQKAQVSSGLACAFLYVQKKLMQQQHVEYFNNARVCS
jgi:hypothetical protein